MNKHNIININQDYKDAFCNGVRLILMERNKRMNKDKQILILTQRIELLEKQNEDLRAENQEMKLQVEESKRFANMPNDVLNRTIKNVRQEEAKFKALTAETQEIKKELENNLEALKKTHALYQSIFSD